jgi:putative FmdB family regulatory protein
MPTYDYGCDTCGPFSESRPMAEFAQPQPCPGCTAMPQRMHPGGCGCCAAPRRLSAEAV